MGLVRTWSVALQSVAHFGSAGPLFALDQPDKSLQSPTLIICWRMVAPSLSPPPLSLCPSLHHAFSFGCLSFQFQAKIFKSKSCFKFLNLPLLFQMVNFEPKTFYLIFLLYHLLFPDFSTHWWLDCTMGLSWTFGSLPAYNLCKL